MIVSLVVNNKSDNKLVDLSAFSCVQYSLTISMGVLISLIFI